MAIKIKGLKETRARIKKQIDSAIIDKGLMQGMAKAATSDVKKTIRSGISPKTGKVFAALKRSTKASRRSFAKNKKGRKSPHFSVNKSNLTMSGKMVRSLRSKVLKNQIFISLKGVHHNSKSGQVTNQQLAEWHDKGAGRLPVRSVFGITKETKAKLIKALDIFLARRLKR